MAFPKMTGFRWFLALTVLAIAVGPFLLSRVDIGGGSTLRSPDEKYLLITWGTMKGSRGGKYTVELHATSPPHLLRSATVQVAKDERTPVVRGRCDANWDMANGTVDFLIEGRPEIRFYFPGNQPASTVGSPSISDDK